MFSVPKNTPTVRVRRAILAYAAAACLVGGGMYLYDRAMGAQDDHHRYALAGILWPLSAPMALEVIGGDLLPHLD